jgi:hypothetical protein
MGSGSAGGKGLGVSAPARSFLNQLVSDESDNQDSPLSKGERSRVMGGLADFIKGQQLGEASLSTATLRKKIRDLLP